MTIDFISGMGMILAPQTMNKRRVEVDDVERGVRADAMDAISDTFLDECHSQTIGLVGVTGIYGRWVRVAGGTIMLILGWLLKLFSTVDFARQRINPLVVAIPIGFGLIPVVSFNSFFHRMGAQKAVSVSFRAARAGEFV